MLVHLPRAAISISNPLWGKSTLLCSYCMQLHQIFWSNFCWSFPPTLPGVEASNNLHWRRRKSSSTVERPSSFGLERQGMEDENMISGDFLKEGHGHGREKAAIYATLETSRSLPKETSLPTLDNDHNQFPEGDDIVEGNLCDNLPGKTWEKTPFFGRAKHQRANRPPGPGCLSSTRRHRNCKAAASRAAVCNSICISEISWLSFQEIAGCFIQWIIW